MINLTDDGKEMKQDSRYLSGLIEEIVNQDNERKLLDSAVLDKPKRGPQTSMGL